MNIVGLLQILNPGISPHMAVVVALRFISLPRVIKI